MKTMDALRMSVIEGAAVDAQIQATKLELMVQGVIDLSAISPFPALKSRLLSAASAYRSVADRLEQAANEGN